nr:hypothetical protein [Arthrobacter sp. M4]
MGSNDPEPRTKRRCNGIHPEPRPDTTSVPECHKGVIVAYGPKAAAVTFGVDFHNIPEELQRLINQVGTKIIEDPAAGARLGDIPPSSTELWFPAFERGLELPDFSEGAALNRFLDCQEISIPSSILKNSKRYAAVGRFVDDAHGHGDLTAIGLSMTTLSRAAIALRASGA